MASFRPKRSLGQNFLVDGNLQRKIVDALDPEPDDIVLEVGPGQGALTRHLLGRVGRLVLVELDDELVQRWQAEAAARPPGEVEVIHRDILKLSLADVHPEAGRLRVIGNIPYNITAPLLFHLLERPRPQDILVMVQREVARRIMAPPGGGEYGALSVGIRSVADVVRVAEVPRTAFRPAPRVDSTVVRITPHHPPRLDEDAETALRTLTRAAFQWRRKQLQRILRDHPDLRLDPRLLPAMEETLGRPLTLRPEALSPDEFVRLSGFLRTAGDEAAR
ncbi:MAG: 16S rRNA (adenine(1518)-N(6)/adenine(1519)-N(6))-dimethyltransferase RsmA [Gemmatimonadota bacterium]